MPADFSTAAKRARLRIAVPPVDIEAIRARSTISAGRAGLRRLTAAIAASLGVIGGAVAFANLGGGVHVWLSGNKTEAVVQSFAQVREPMSADVRSIAARTTFPVVFPVGVPRDARVLWIAYDPPGKPNMVMINYRRLSGGPYMGVTLLDSAKLQSDRALMPGGPSQALTTSGGTRWRIGREVVLVQSRHLSPADIERMKAAMQNATPEQSQSAFTRSLTTIKIQIVDPRMAPVGDAAQRVAPPGDNVLLGKWEIRQLAQIASKGKPLRDGRTIYYTNIPQIHGRPDYRNATVQWPKSIALPAGGVKAVASALRSAKIGPNCGCAILVHRSGSAYAIWKIDATPPYRAEKLSGP